MTNCSFGLCFLFGVLQVKSWKSVSSIYRRKDQSILALIFTTDELGVYLNVVIVR